LIINSAAFPDVAFTVRSSRGTYVRTLAHDMGERLGCGAHLTSLSRTKSGLFTLNNAPTLDELADILTHQKIDEILLAPQQVLPHLRKLELNENSARRVACGSIPSREDVFSREWAVYGEQVMLARDGQLLAVAEGVFRDGLETMRLLRVFG
jgi:tRNA pseudouridine55 synthase